MKQSKTRTFKTRSSACQTNEKNRGMFEIQKSGDKTSSGEIGLDNRTHASHKVGQDKEFGGVSVPCQHATSVEDAQWKTLKLRMVIKDQAPPKIESIKIQTQNTLTA